MRIGIAFFILTLSFTIQAETNFDRVQSLKTVTRIAFGSCSNQNDQQPLWTDVLAQKPDLWIWSGDTVYADWGGRDETVASSYQKLLALPDFANLRQVTPMIGTWDDHDYGHDEADGRLSYKQESQRQFQDFYDIPVDHSLREREGVYASYEFGDDQQKIKVILLDNRYHKNLDPSAPLLGEQQWQWLEQEFKKSTAHLHIIVSSLSIFSPTMPYTQEWNEFPREVKRLQELLKNYKVKAPLFLTGDKHFSTIFKYWGQLEFLSSGMTHTAPYKTWWYLARKFPNTFFGLSYGVIDIAWEDSTPKLTLFIRDGRRDIHKNQVIWRTNTGEFTEKSTGPSMQWDLAAPVD
jgi:alkaline phosphatase D